MASDDDLNRVECWCFDASIPASAIGRIPLPLRGRACICRRCAEAADRPLAQGVAQTKDPGGRPAIELTSGGARALISTVGAQVLSWDPGSGDVLWTASQAQHEPRAPVRGGIPVVFPWFGDHPRGPSMPAHGFARSCDWHLVATDVAAVTLALRDDDATRAIWPHEFSLELEIALSDALRITMRVHNPTNEPFTLEQALHTYFAVGDVREASVHGFEGVPFTEHAAAPEAEWDTSAPLRFRAETDRVFQGAPEQVSICAPALSREVSLKSRQARSAIVWNPWPAKTARLAQMAPEDWQTFCCVETANCKENAVTLAPRARHEMTLTIRSAQR